MGDWRNGLLLFAFLLLMIAQTARSSIIVSKHNRAINLNPKLGKWPGKEIPYYIDPAYTDEEEGQIRLAMLRVMSDLDMCVRFTEVAAESPAYKLKVTPTDTSSTLNATFSKLCHTFAGTYLANMAQGKTEQSLLLTTGPQGCFDGSMHSLMKYFAVSMGLRNEHQRPDRDGYLQISNDKIDPQLQVAYQTYPAAEVHITCPYDYCSITHNQPTDFAAVNGTEVFTVKEAPYFIPKLDQLSTCDCQQLKALYGCDPATCEILDCASQVKKPSTVPPTSTTKGPSGRDDEAMATTLCYSVPPATMNGSSPGSLTTLGPGATSPMTTQSSQTTTCTVVTNIVPAAPLPESQSSSPTTKAPPVRRRKREGRGKALRVINSDQNYLKWSQNTVPYFIDPSYTASQKAMIQQAVRKVSADLNGCVQFVEVSPSVPTYKIHIAPVDDSPNAKRGCHSLPGVSRHLVSTGSTEQKLILTSGPGGCFDGNIGTIMKYFVLVLGRRNEHQRPDRDNYIEVLHENILPGMEVAYEKYTVNNVSMPTYPYDYCSITHNDLNDFSTSGSPAFVIKNSAVTSIPKLDRLSEYDCKEICNTYECDASTCAPLDCPQAAALNKPPVQFPPQLTSGDSGMIPVTVSPTPDGGANVCLKLPNEAIGASTTVFTILDMEFRQEVPPGANDTGSKSESLTGTASVTCTTDGGSSTTQSILASSLNQTNNHQPPNKTEVFQTLQALIKQMEAQLNKGDSTIAPTGSTVSPASGATGSGSTSSGKPSSGSPDKPNYALLTQQVQNLINILQAKVNDGANTSSSRGSTPSSTDSTPTGGSTASTTGSTGGSPSGATVPGSTDSSSTSAVSTTASAAISSQSGSSSTTPCPANANCSKGGVLDPFPEEQSTESTIIPPPPEQAGRHDGSVTVAFETTVPADDYDDLNPNDGPTALPVPTTNQPEASLPPNSGQTAPGSPPPAILFDDFTEAPFTSDLPGDSPPTSTLMTDITSMPQSSVPLTASPTDAPPATSGTSLLIPSTTSLPPTVGSMSDSSVNSEIPTTQTPFSSSLATSETPAASSPPSTSAFADTSTVTPSAPDALSSYGSLSTSLTTEAVVTESSTLDTPPSEAATTLPPTTTMTTQSTSTSPSFTSTSPSTSATTQQTSPVVSTASSSTVTPSTEATSTALPTTASTTLPSTLPTTTTPATTSTTIEQTTETRAPLPVSVSTTLPPSTVVTSTSTTTITPRTLTTVLTTILPSTAESSTTSASPTSSPTMSTSSTSATDPTSTMAATPVTSQATISSAPSSLPPTTSTTSTTPAMTSTLIPSSTSGTTIETASPPTSGSTEESTTPHFLTSSNTSLVSTLHSTTRLQPSTSWHPRSTTRYGSTFGRTTSHRPAFLSTTKLSLQQIESNLHEILSGIQLPGAGGNGTSANGTSSSGTATTKSFQQLQAALHNMIVQLGAMTSRTKRPVGATLQPGSKPTHSAAYLSMQASLDEMIKKLEEDAKKRTTTPRTTTRRSTTETPPPPPPP
ncbi:hypothetical protein RvY_01066 [Ramazzottius varieornatus]|uniref:Metalloendopeptidase n=1 Tax=Ramazzottius varieornatus TaxID=947166 RepID=A0A1D1UIZ7_RAMVA|nr:hypothetical protein RvY_01066 [Ramazzottius varieornatus]